MTIFKYTLSETDTNQVIEVPEAATFLCVKLVNDTPTLYALVDPNRPKIKRTISIYGTGTDIPDKGWRHQYIGTYQLRVLTFHVFEELA